MTTTRLQDFSWERMIAAVDAVRERASRIATALERAGIKHAVVGGNAIAAWVARVDVEAVRNTKDVDMLVRREDFERVVEVAQSVGFVYQNVAGVDLFLDGPNGSVRSAIRIVFAREKVRADYLLPAPDVTESEAGPEFTVAALDALVRMKLTSFRLKDKVHLLDLLDVGLIDEAWCNRFPPELGARLRELVESMEGTVTFVELETDRLRHDLWPGRGESGSKSGGRLDRLKWGCFDALRKEGLLE
jgi:hypothetical protein